ncbi:hypothetical protein KCV03_g88, partial [Aureobasidium melanogenum]
MSLDSRQDLEDTWLCYILRPSGILHHVLQQLEAVHLCFSSPSFSVTLDKSFLSSPETLLTGMRSGNLSTLYGHTFHF